MNKEQSELVEGVDFGNSFLTLDNDEIGEISEILRDDESLICYIRKQKRLRRREVSHVCEIGKEANSLITALPHSSRYTCPDKKDEVEPVVQCCSPITGENTVMGASEIPMEISDSEALEEDIGLCLNSVRDTSNSEKTQETVNDVLGQSLDVTCGIQHISQRCSENMGEKTVIARDGISAENKLKVEDPSISKDSRKITSTGENAGETVSEIVINHNMEKAGEATEEHVNGVQGSASQAVIEITNFTVERTFSHCTGKKLLVLDVNGLLIDISSYVPYDYDPDEIILRKAIFKRPYCDDFLGFCFENFHVGLWSSRTRANMEPIIDYLLGNAKQNLLFCWDQSHCTNTGFYTVEKRHKPLYLKKLKNLWDKCDPDLPWERGVYNESNTLLLDDSPYKALCNPRYSAIFPYSYRFRDATDSSLGPGGDLRVYLEGLATADNVQEYVRQNPFGQRAITEKNLSWGYYRKVIEACSSPRQSAPDESSTLTPTV